LSQIMKKPMNQGKKQKGFKYFLINIVHPDNGDVKALFHQYKKELNWELLIEYACQQKMFGRLIETFETHHLLRKLPTHVQEMIDTIREKHYAQYLKAIKSFEILNEAFKKENIPVIFFKGILFSSQYYNHPCSRPFYDIDLLVRPKDFDKALEIVSHCHYKFYHLRLTANAFVPLGKLPKLNEEQFTNAEAKKLYQKFHYHYPFVAPNKLRLLPLDLHWQLFSSNNNSIHTTAIWHHTKQLSLHNYDVVTFDDPLLILYMSVRIILWGPANCRLHHISDLITLLASTKNNDCTKQLWQLATECHLTRELTLSLKLLHSAFDFDTSSFIVAKESKSNFFFYGCLTTFKYLLFTDRKYSGIDYLHRIFAETLWNISLLQIPREPIRHIARYLIQFSSKHFHILKINSLAWGKTE